LRDAKTAGIEKQATLLNNEATKIDNYSLVAILIRKLFFDPLFIKLIAISALF
jgi:hypothetical protein